MTTTGTPTTLNIEALEKRLAQYDDGIAKLKIDIEQKKQALQSTIGARTAIAMLIKEHTPDQKPS